MTLSNKAYDVLKMIAQIILPAIGTLLFGLGESWGWSWAPPVVGTITAIDTFLGAMLKISSDKYNAASEESE